MAKSLVIDTRKTARSTTYMLRCLRQREGVDDERDPRRVSLDGELERVPGVAAVGAERVEEGLDEDGVLPRRGGAPAVGEAVVARRGRGLRLEDEEVVGAGRREGRQQEQAPEQRGARGPRHPRESSPRSCRPSGSRSPLLKSRGNGERGASPSVVFFVPSVLASVLPLIGLIRRWFSGPDV